MGDVSVHGIYLLLVSNHTVASSVRMVAAPATSAAEVRLTGPAVEGDWIGMPSLLQVLWRSTCAACDFSTVVGGEKIKAVNGQRSEQSVFTCVFNTVYTSHGINKVKLGEATAWFARPPRSERQRNGEE